MGEPSESELAAVSAELSAAKSCAEVLSPLCDAARKRTIVWLNDVFIGAKFASFIQLQKDYKALVKSQEKSIKRIEAIQNENEEKD